MNKSLFFGKNVVVQGISGSQGAFHTKAMVQAGTHIVAGTSLSKAGQVIDGIPIFATLKDIQNQYIIDTCLVFVPAPHAKGAIVEAIEAKVPLIVCITEGIPVHDMLYIKKLIKNSDSTLIGPNSPGVLLPGVHRLGIIPEFMGLPGAPAGAKSGATGGASATGNVGIVSRSGTLTYEAMAGLSEKGIGQKYVIGIGGDPIRGTGFIDCLELFQNDPDVDKIVIIGEIGGTDEIAAADYIKQHVTKPIYGYIAGHHAPAGVQLGHAGAILGSNEESAQAKTAALQAAGVITAKSIVELIARIAQN